MYRILSTNEKVGNFRSLGVENSRGRVASKICKQTSKVRSADNKFVKYCTYVKYFRRGKKIIRKRCYRISTTRSGRPGFLQHLFHCSKKRRRSPSNIKLETSQCIPYMEKSHFKMETIRSIIQALHLGEWGSSLDLRDAYL